MRYHIKWDDQVIISKDGLNVSGSETLDTDQAKFLLYYITLDASVNTWSTAKQEWFFAAARIVGKYAPEIHNNQGPYDNTVFDYEFDMEKVEMGLEHFCPDTHEYGAKTKDKKSYIGYWKK